MKYFIDTEFSERGPKHPIELISIGIVCEDGREIYMMSRDFDAEACSDWVKNNVLNNLGLSEADQSSVKNGNTLYGLQTHIIAREIREFVGDDKPEFWGYYADYDWVVFCQMFGTMMDLPKGWPMYCRDIKQFCDLLGNPKLPEQGKGEHNALADARWNKQAYEFLIQGGRAHEFSTVK